MHQSIWWVSGKSKIHQLRQLILLAACRGCHICSLSAALCLSEGLFNFKPVQLLGGSSADGFTAIKMTALARPQFLVDAHFIYSSMIAILFSKSTLTTRREHVMLTQWLLLKLSFSEILTKWQRFFSFLASQQGKQNLGLPEQKLEVQQLQVMPCRSRFPLSLNYRWWMTSWRLVVICL